MEIFSWETNSKYLVQPYVNVDRGMIFSVATYCEAPMKGSDDQWSICDSSPNFLGDSLFFQPNSRSHLWNFKDAYCMHTLSRQKASFSPDRSLIITLSEMCYTKLNQIFNFAQNHFTPYGELVKLLHTRATPQNWSLEGIKKEIKMY